MKRVIVVGLGLIGGSIGLALRQASATIELVGIDKESVLRTAGVRELLARSLATEGLDYAALRSLDADLVVLAIPVGAIVASVRDWLDLEVPVTDCGSTKRAIVAAARCSAANEWFVPGHPMAGRERGGFESASADLFRGRRWLVCPANASSRAIDVAKCLIRSVGAVWTEMTPEAHDSAVAITSHLPQLLASWLAAAIQETQHEAAGPAFADMTRIAGGSEAIWRDIFSTNSAPLAQAARSLAEDFSKLASDFESQAPRLDHALELLSRARRRNEPK